MKARTIILTCAVAVTTVAAGCGSAILGDDPSTGLSITVLKSPIQPVVREGEENTAPVPGARVRVSLRTGGSADLLTDAAGVVAVPLEPGVYVVDVIECPGTLALPAAEEVEVAAGIMTPVSMLCDTGIR